MTKKNPPVDPCRSFLRRLPLTLLAGMLVWLMVRPVLDVAVCALTETLIRAFEYPRVTRLVAINHGAEVRRSDFHTASGVHTQALTEIHFNIIVLLALSLALSRPFGRKRLERLFMAASLLYLTQVLTLLFHVKYLYATALGEWSFQNYSRLAREFFGFCRYFSDLPGRFSFPFLLWLGFNWDQVAVILGNQASRESTKPSGKRARKGKQR